jgi:hypothetical protein
LDRSIDVNLRFADLAADRQVGEEVVEEDVNEHEAGADLEPGRGGGRIGIVGGTTGGQESRQDQSRSSRASRFDVPASRPTS